MFAALAHRTISRSRQFGLLFLVGTFIALPSVVCAAQHVSALRDSTPIRLNRGLDEPQAKCRVAPPEAPIVVRPAPLDAVIIPAPRLIPVEEALPDSSWIPAPDTPRGPPSLSFV